MEATAHVESTAEKAESTTGNVVVLVERRYVAQAQPAGLIEALQRREQHVHTMITEAESFALDRADWLKEADLVVARGRSWPLLCLLGWAEARGIRTINSRRAIEAVYDKAEMAVRLVSDGISTPATFIGPPQKLAAVLSRGSYPLVLKPVHGDNGNGIRLVCSPDELRRAPGSVVLAQHFVRGDGFDLKLYCIGDLVFAVRKPCTVPALQALYPAAAGQEPAGQMVPVTAEMRELARKCRRIFGLELFGIDTVETPQRLVVLEVNDFPNYTAVPAAGDLIADYIAARTQLEKRL